jgi:heterodisulfide reductase subunit D
VQKFNYSAYFRRVQDMKKIQLDASAVSWIERYETPTDSHELVLMLGCNILRTPHIARQVVRVFEHLKLDFVAVAGTQYCCGIVWDTAKDIQKGQGVAQRTITRLESHRPRKVVMWCPSCNVHFADAVLGRDKKTPNFEITDAVQFLASRAREGDGLPWVKSVNKKVVIHAHAGLDGHPEGQRRARQDREAVLDLLSHVPGLDILDVIISAPEMDYDCGPSVMTLDQDVFQSHQRATIGKALDLGAEQIVTISHACQREWCGENTGQLGFRNYISIIGEALGLPVDADLLTQYKAASSVEEIVQTSRPIWASYGMTENEAKELVDRYRAEGGLRGYTGTKGA